MKPPDFIHTPNGIESVEINRVISGQLGRFQITGPQISIREGLRTLAGEQMKTQPFPIRSGDPLGFAKESHEQQEHEISVYLGLQFEIAGKVFRFLPRVEDGTDVAVSGRR